MILVVVVQLLQFLIFFTDLQRRLVLQACEIAEINCLKILNDTAAVAIVYGIYTEELDDKPVNVAFVDVGHANTSVSIVSFTKSKFQVLTTAFIKVGAGSLEEFLFDHYVAEIKKKI